MSDVAQKTVGNNASVITNQLVRLFDGTTVITGWSVIRLFALLFGQCLGQWQEAYIEWFKCVQPRWPWLPNSDFLRIFVNGIREKNVRLIM